MRGHLWRVALVGAIVGLAVADGSGRAAEPSVNGKVAFASYRNGNPEIYTENPDATGTTRLTNDPNSDTDPAWSPDGRRIAYTSNRAGSDDIFLMSADGTGQAQLTTSPASDVNPTWSPGGRNIAFASNRDGDAEIFVMNEDGTGQTQLTHNEGASDAVPSWSPDGSKIAFTSTRDGNGEIYVMNVDGTGVTRLTAAPGDDVSPDWSPDGSRIAFASNRDGNWEVYVMKADGSEQTRLTRNLDTDLDPAWSPDGRLLAFSSNRDANREIYTMNADGTGQTRLTTDPAEDTTPDWQYQAVPPPPPKPVSEAAFRVRWKESRVFGMLEVAGEVPGLSKVQLALRRGKRIELAVGLVLAKGSFTKRLAVPRGLAPGAYLLDVAAVGSPTELTPQRIPLRLDAPPEGVVSDAWASTAVGGPPLVRIPASNGTAWAHFRLSALPQPGRTLATRWYVNGSVPPGARPRIKPRQTLVIAYIESTVAGAPLPRGTYTCVLSAGKTVVKRLTFPVS